MAKLIVSTRLDCDMSNIDFSNLLYGESYDAKDDSFTIDYGNGVVDVFGGKHLAYDANGVPEAGTILSFSEILGKEVAVSITGLSIQVTSIVDAALSDDYSDDAALITRMLNGRDRIAGGEGDDNLFSGGSRDIVNGNGGNDTIAGNRGNDKLSGGAGSDVFIFRDRDGNDIITDFGRGRDKIDLIDVREAMAFFEDFGNDLDQDDEEFADGTENSIEPDNAFQSFLDTFASESGVGVVLKFQTLKIVLSEVELVDLDKRDFMF